MSTANPYEPQPPLAQLAESSKRRWPVSRIVLLVLLAVAVGLLATDWLHGRIPRNRAYELLAAELPEEEDTQAKGTAAPPKHSISKDVEFCTIEKVHELLKRSPDATDSKPNPNHIDTIVTETYRFRGAFKTYLLVVEYDKRAHVAQKGPNTIMTSVRRSAD